jgi:hypothetical protein
MEVVGRFYTRAAPSVLPRTKQDVQDERGTSACKQTKEIVRFEEESNLLMLSFFIVRPSLFPYLGRQGRKDG